MRAVWKIPRAWAAPSLPARTALYPALHLRWAGWAVGIGREFPARMWADAALRVLVTDGALADDDELGAWIAGAEHDRGARLAELALAAALHRALLRVQRLGGAEQIVTADRNVAESEIAVMAQGLAECAQRVGEQGARIPGGHAG